MNTKNVPKVLKWKINPTFFVYNRGFPNWGGGRPLGNFSHIIPFFFWPRPYWDNKSLKNDSIITVYIGIEKMRNLMGVWKRRLRECWPKILWDLRAWQFRLEAGLTVYYNFTQIDWKYKRSNVLTFQGLPYFAWFWWHQGMHRKKLLFEEASKIYHFYEISIMVFKRKRLLQNISLCFEQAIWDRKY